MKLKNKLILAITSLSAIALPVTLLASCSKAPESNNNPNDKPITPPNEKPTEPVEPPVVLKPTTSKNEINKSVLGLEQTVEKNAFKINSQWIFNNKTKLLDGDTSLFTSVEDILQFSAQPSANDETKLDINFTLKAGKARAENNEPTIGDTSFKVIVTNFDAPTRTLETLSELLNNFLSSKVQPKKFIMPEDKFIRINERPGEGTGTTRPTTTWLTAQNPNNSRGISLGSSTGPNCIWVPYGWDKSQSNNEQSDVWNWLENNGISNGDLHSYINNLLKDYKYINTSDEVTTIYLYSQLREYKQDEKTSGGIWVYRKKYAPIGWGFKINNSGRDDVIINDGIRVPGDGNYIENSFKSNEVNFDFGYKWETGGTTGAEETIDFTPNYIVNETVINGFKVN